MNNNQVNDQKPSTWKSNNFATLVNNIRQAVNISNNHKSIVDLTEYDEMETIIVYNEKWSSNKNEVFIFLHKLLLLSTFL